MSNSFNLNSIECICCAVFYLFIYLFYLFFFFYVYSMYAYVIFRRCSKIRSKASEHVVDYLVILFTASLQLGLVSISMEEICC